MHTGIDIGLKCTALVTIDDDGEIVAKEAIQNIEYTHPAERYFKYCQKVDKYFSNNKITGTIIMENPMGSFIGNSIKLAELKGAYLITILPYTKKEKFILPHATEIKKFFTGSGNASKEEMIVECKRRGYYPESDHDADAIAMALMGIEHYSKGLTLGISGKRSKRISQKTF